MSDDYAKEQDILMTCNEKKSSSPYKTLVDALKDQSNSITI